jgi:hypothetical protein
MNVKLARGLNPRRTHENTLVMRRSLNGDEHQGQQYWHAPVRCGRCNVRDMEGLAASVVLIAILLGVLLVVVGLVYLLAQRLPKRLPEPPRKPVNRRFGIGSMIVVLLIIGLWAGIKSASNPRPQPAVQLTCPAGSTWVLLQGLCLQL